MKAMPLLIIRPCNEDKNQGNPYVDFWDLEKNHQNALWSDTGEHLNNIFHIARLLHIHDKIQMHSNSYDPDDPCTGHRRYAEQMSTADVGTYPPRL